MNDNMDFVMGGDDDGDSADDYWLFTSIGGTLNVLAHENDPVPAAVGGPWVVKGFGFGGILPFSNTGDVLWYLDWDDPDTTKDTGLFHNTNLLLQEGVSSFGGTLVNSVPNGDTEIEMSADGTMAIFEVELAGPSNFDVVYLVELEPSVGTPFCDPNENNSTGVPTTMDASNGTGVGSDLHLDASNGPVDQFGYFLVGTAVNDPGIIDPFEQWAPVPLARRRQLPGPLQCKRRSIQLSRAV